MFSIFKLLNVFLFFFFSKKPRKLLLKSHKIIGHKFVPECKIIIYIFLHMVYNGSRVGLSIIELNDGEEVHT